MLDDAASELLEALSSCRCCLQREPNKMLNKPYTYCGQTEVYLDMLKDCFDIHLTADSHECRICDVCVSHLRIASNFKMQVKRCQMELRERLERALEFLEQDTDVKTEPEDYYSSETLLDEKPEIKQEVGDEEEGDDMSHEWYGMDGTRVLVAPSVSGRARQQLAMSTVLVPRLKHDDTLECRDTFRHDVLLHTDSDDTQETRTDSPEINTQEIHIDSADIHTQGIHTCGTCGEQFKLKISLTKHVQIHNTPYSCQICSKEYFSQNLFDTHKCEREVCDIRSKKIKTEPELIKLLSKHTGQKRQYKKQQIGKNREKKPFRCEICNRLCSSLICLKTHMRVHTGEKPYACDVCDKRFSQISSLNLHRSIHTGEKPYACTVCNEKFRLKCSLERHLRLKCQPTREYSYICNKKFSQKRSMILHTSIHTGEKPFSCNICHKNFSTKGNMTKHMRKICNRTKQFTTLSTRTKRMAIHTGQKQQTTYKPKREHVVNKKNKSYNCKICNKSFINVSSLKLHKAVHKGVKSYTCLECNKKFSHRSSLALHYSVHTGEKPYSCKVCNKKFRVKGNMKTHMKVHGDEWA